MNDDVADAGCALLAMLACAASGAIVGFLLAVVFLASRGCL